MIVDRTHPPCLPPHDTSRACSPRDAANFLKQPLGVSLFGNDLRAELFTAHPFRMLRLPGDASRSDIRRAYQRLQLSLTKRPETVWKRFFPAGYDERIDLTPNRVREALGQLDDPRTRLIAELFWPARQDVLQPYLDAGSFSGGLDTLGVRSHDSGDLALPASVAGGVLGLHGIAVAATQIAVAVDLDGDAAVARSYWRLALRAWSMALRDPGLRVHWKERMAALDPGAHPDPKQVMELVERTVVGLYARFVESLAVPAETANIDQVRLRLEDLREVPFDATATSRACDELTRNLATRRLGPLAQRMRTAFESETSLPYAQVHVRIDPFLRHAEELLDDLAGRWSLPLAGLTGAFDALARETMKAVNGCVAYDRDDRQRALLAGVLVWRRLRRLPLSTDLRTDLDQQDRDDLEYLYGEFAPDRSQLDPAECWFMPGWPADVRSSIEVEHYAITKLLPSSISVQRRVFIVPRSTAAAGRANGPVDIDELLRLSDGASSAEFQEIRARARALEEEMDAALEPHRQAALETRERVQAEHQDQLRKLQERYEAGASPRPWRELVGDYEAALRTRSGEMANGRGLWPLAALAPILLLGALALLFPVITAELRRGGLGAVADVDPMVPFLGGLVAAAGVVALTKYSRDRRLTRVIEAVDEPESGPGVASLGRSGRKLVGRWGEIGQAYIDLRERHARELADVERNRESREAPIRRRFETRLRAVRKKAERAARPAPDRSVESFPPIRAARAAGFFEGVLDPEEGQQRMQLAVQDVVDDLNPTQVLLLQQIIDENRDLGFALLDELYLVSSYRRRRTFRERTGVS